MRHHLPYYHLPSSFIIDFFHILTNTKLVLVSFTYYHSLMFDFSFNVTYSHRVSDI
jgi:hypothetical protein